MASSDSESSEEVVNHGPKHRQMSRQDKMTVFFAVRSTMVNGRPKYGILSQLANQLGFERTTVSRQWASMRKKLAHLLNNQDEDRPHGDHPHKL